MAILEVQHIEKHFGATQVLNDISFSLEKGQALSIIGSSGSGKTTLLRCLNFLETPDNGTISVDGNVIFDAKDPSTQLEKEIRKKRLHFGLVFQNFNLFPQYTALQNVTLARELMAKEHGHETKAEIEAAGRELLAQMGLADRATHYPHQLSGGQQQRVAIARALATNPQVLLCDEATSALDPKTTHQILDLIRDINQKLGITVIVITHQMSVVQEICNRVAILEHGAVVEEGEVAQVFADPKADATRHLVYPEMADSAVISDEHGQRVRIIFNGGPAAKTPLIAQMAMEVGVAASILGASTRSVGERAYGYILLEIPGGPDELAKAVNFLRKTPDVTVSVEVNYGESKEVEA